MGRISRIVPNFKPRKFNKPQDEESVWKELTDAMDKYLLKDGDTLLFEITDVNLVNSARDAANKHGYRKGYYAKTYQKQHELPPNQFGIERCAAREKRAYGKKSPSGLYDHIIIPLKETLLVDGFAAYVEHENQSGLQRAFYDHHGDDWRFVVERVGEKGLRVKKTSV